MQLRILNPDGKATDRTVSGSSIRLGRDSACEVAFDGAVYPKVSGEHARIERTAAGLALTPRSQSNKTLLNDQPIAQPTTLKVGDRIRLGFTGPIIEVVSLAEPPKEEFSSTVQANSGHMNLLRGSLAVERFQVGNGGIIGREKDAVQFLLDHPHVSRQHASLKVENGSVVLTDLDSANGTQVNGRLIAEPTALKPGDRIDVGPFSLRFDGDSFVSRSRSNNIELLARKLTRVVKDQATGNPLTLLHDINLVIRPKEFVCLLGPSGSGKSTLLAVLSGRNSPDGGRVTINGQDLHAHFETLKRDLAVVPQKDVLHDSLALGAALRYTAELRLPPDTERDEIENRVTAILDVVGLSQRRATLIRNLSGGQVKRASLGNEMMAGPSLLFVDEATSGLDEQTDGEMMALFRQVADSGKTVVCITHNLANVEANCHLVVILVEGGWLAFIGTPEEAKSYFGVSRLGDVYRKLAERKPEEWQTAFRSSPFFIRYIRERMTDEAETKEKVRDEGKQDERPSVPSSRQTWILIRRYFSIWRGDLQALLAMLGQSLLVAVLLGIVFGRPDNVAHSLEHALREHALSEQTLREHILREQALRTLNLLFLLNICCFWFGCNNAAKELVKERVIYRRERDFNLRIDSYFTSKTVVLLLIAWIQVSLLFGIVRLWCAPAGSPVSQWFVLAALAAAGTMLGLLISALARTEEVAVALVPIAIIPQIVLAGVIAPLHGLGTVLADGLITAHWGARALEALLPKESLLILQRDHPSFQVPLGVLVVHVFVFAVATLIVLARQDRMKRNV